MRRFFISAAQISHAQALLRGAEFHHLRRVLRLEVGAQVTLKDDLGREHCGVIAQLSPSEAIIALTATTDIADRRFSLTLVQGMLKGPKMDLVIEKATELGVNRILPFYSTFTVAAVPPDRQAERSARWLRIAQSAAKQSGSPTPRITSPQAFTTTLEALSSEPMTVLCYEHEKQYTLKRFAQEYPQLDSLSLIVGSEGGFSPEEIEKARTVGVTIVGLGARILRAETAGIVASALCQFLWNE